MVCVVLSATWACWPGKFVRTLVPRAPNFGLREILIFSASQCRAATLWLLALYCFVITPCMASKTGPVDLEVEPGWEMKPVCLSTIVIL